MATGDFITYSSSGIAVDTGDDYVIGIAAADSDSDGYVNITWSGSTITGLTWTYPNLQDTLKSERDYKKEKHEEYMEKAKEMKRLLDMFP